MKYRSEPEMSDRFAWPRDGTITWSVRICSMVGLLPASHTTPPATPCVALSVTSNEHVEALVDGREDGV